MTPSGQPGGSRAMDIAAALARWVLGGYFIYMGLSKAVGHDLSMFLTQVHEYGIVHNPLVLNSIASALPWFEAYCGLLLVAGVGVRGVSLVIVAMLVPFTLLVLRRALAIATAKGLAFCAVKFNCGCGAGEVLICHKLAENSALILLGLWLVARKTGRFCLRFGLFETSPDPSGSG